MKIAHFTHSLSSCWNHGNAHFQRGLLRELALAGVDGVLAFRKALAAVYRRWGWGERVFVWHEAADTRLFHPPRGEENRAGLERAGRHQCPPQLLPPHA